MTITKELPCRLLHRQGIGGVGSLQPVPQNILRLPGVPGNYPSTPDSPATSIIGDIDLRAKLSMDNWIPSSLMRIINKEIPTTQRSYSLGVDSTGKILIRFSLDGTTAFQNGSTASLTFTPGTIAWIRATRAATSGDCNFYTSTDGLTWTALGTTVTNNPGTIFDSTAPIEIGIRSISNEPLAGYIYYAEVRSGIGGPIVAAFDPSTAGVTGDRTPSTLTTISNADAVYLPGLAGNYISTPDTVANSVTGDIDFRIKCSADDWTPTVSGALAGKWVNGGQRSWRLSLATDGKLQLFGSADGTTLIGAGISSAAVPFTDGQVGWVRYTWRQSDNRLQYFTSTDGTTWTQLGVDASLVIAALRDTTSPLELFSTNNGAADFLAGNVYYAEVRNGINGPIVAQFDAATSVTGIRTPGTKQNIDGSVWTLNGAAWKWNTHGLQSSQGVLRLPGVSGNYVSTPDAADISITGDIDVRIKLAMDDWTPATFNIGRFMGKWTGGQRAWYFCVNTGGTLQFGWSTDGTNNFSVNSSAVTGVTDGAVKWLRATRNVTTGDVIFYTGDDGVAWTQLGTTQATTPGSMVDTTAFLEFGSSDAGSNAMQGYLYYADIRSGIGGAVVASFDAAAMPATGRTPTTTVQSGRTWTVNGSAWSWINESTQPVWTINGTNWWWAQEGRTPYQNGITLDPQYVRFDGTAGNYASTPDSAGLSIVGDIDVRVKVALDNWTPTTNQSLLAKYDTGSSQRSYRLFVSGPTGAISFAFSVDGITPSTAISSWIPAYAPGTVKWIRVTRAAATGIITFYDSDDGVTWTQRTAPTQATGAIFDSTAPATVGCFLAAGSPSELLVGKVYYAEIRNGIGGAIVGNFGPYLVRALTIRTPTTVGDSGGATWTINGSAWSYGLFASPLINTPDTAALSIVGDIDLRVKAALSDWQTLPTQSFLANRGSNLGYQLRTSSNGGGFLQMLWGDGAANRTVISTVALTYTPGQTGWVRATLAVATGDTKFYTSPDGVTWTQLGATVTFGATAIGDANTQLEIGTVPTGGQRLQGTIYYAEIRNGIAGTVVGVFDPNAVKPTDDELPTTIPSRTGEVYTITGSGWHWGAAA